MASMSETQRNENGQINSITNNFEELQIKTKSKKKKEDNANEFLKSLEPGRRKLTSVESQRVISVIDDCSRKIEIVTLLPFIVENLDRFSVLLGAEIVHLVQQYDGVEKKYSKAFKKYRQIRSKAGPEDAESEDFSDTESRPQSQLSLHSDWLTRAELEEIITVLESLKETMKSIIRSIVRMFGKNPSALKTINSERRERAFEANNFVDELHGLKDLVFLRLVTSSGEELEKIRQFMDLTTKDEKARTMIKKLSGNLEVAIKEKDEAVIL